MTRNLRSCSYTWLRILKQEIWFPEEEESESYVVRIPGAAKENEAG